MDMDGRVIHSWNLDWFRLWPDAAHLPEEYIPKSKPGVSVHGAIVLDNGDLVFNYDWIGTVRINVYGDVVWRLPYQTHHSLHQHTDGNIWACGMIKRAYRDIQFPFRDPPYYEYTIIEFDRNGIILNEWSLPEILYKNKKAGLLSMNFRFHSYWPDPPNDRLHLNDVEILPKGMQNGFFSHDDILISMRNINTILVINKNDLLIKYISTGSTSMQHDPDFVDANTISVFDNRTIFGESKVTMMAVVLDSVYEINLDDTFFCPYQGKHQWLENGNLLITETENGCRAFEVDSSGSIVWQFTNYVGKGVVGHLTEVQRIPLEYARFYTDSTNEGN
jgi:hypothetical protein